MRTDSGWSRVSWGLMLGGDHCSAGEQSGSEGQSSASRLSSPQGHRLPECPWPKTGTLHASALSQASLEASAVKVWLAGTPVECGAPRGDSLLCL